ncbi:DUF2231 domain-containing protein [Alicyclobacillus dauci]|uniref:DUF2231 domain-containing protein n=1 Tax=Alicyclobacillus dauci TaxID=1475485 RepID=A0ABY6Z2J8_9BACL|nr:DUF2231 domain-containing protein [Alicyclobacillus dauci]WAH36907.1 DUF2231 domain-containing protein [Alicyclobacillus dauci]
MLTSLYHLFPRTIHPMVVHFTIAVNFLTSFVGIIGLFRRNDKMFSRGFFYLLILSILSTIAAGVAGAISEYYIAHIPGAVQPMLHDHKRDGELTGVFLVLSFVAQFFFGKRTAKVSVIAFVLCVISTVLVSVAGHLGGSMVYNSGLGVH